MNSPFSFVLCNFIVCLFFLFCLKFHSFGFDFRKKVFVLFLAVVAVAVAVAMPAPPPQTSINAPSHIESRQQLENRKIDPLSEGVEPNQDLFKGSSSYGYGYYGPHTYGHYGHYGSPYYHRYGIFQKSHKIIIYQRAQI